MYFVGASDISANQLLDCADAPEYRETKSDQVEASLLEYFMDSEEIPCQQIYDFYGGNGISKRTVDGAKKKLGIRSVKRGDAWYWVRPDSIPPQRKNEGCNLVSI